MISKVSHRLRARKADGLVLTKILSSAVQPYRPLMAHLVVIRRCNLSCGYCYEYDKTSEPVSLEALKERIERLRRLDTVFVTLTGGEALLHPDIVALVGYVRDCGMIPVMNTNGYLLTKERIQALGRAGLFALQISIDTVQPNATTKKSLRPLTPKLKLLAQHASFRVRVNTVLGSGDPAQAVEVARAVMQFGFDAKCTLVRDASGKPVPLDEESRTAYEQIRALGGRSSIRLSEDFQLDLIEQGRVEWKCRAGARYFTVCENGLVHLCESSYGNPGVPLAEYDADDIRRAFHLRKSCAPTCAVAYAHQGSRLDRFRHQDNNPTSIVKRSWADADRDSTFVAAERLRKVAS